MKYVTLKAGDIRQATDQIRRTVPYSSQGPRGCGDFQDFSTWQTVSLVGHAILPVDLKVAEFRREVAVD